MITTIRACLSVFFCLCLSVLWSQTSGSSWVTPFERDSTWSATKDEAHDFFIQLAVASPYVNASLFGTSDGFLPIYEVIISANGLVDPVDVRSAGKKVVLINNAIHPGESEGVDASMMLARDLVNQPSIRKLLDQVVVVILPYYNTDGGLQRSPTFRANQQGPRDQGFRGNASNLDLNRDFVKCDSRNAQTFTRLFRKWDPDLFVDTHTSNGADYQATMTVIATQPDKLPPALAAFQQSVFLPELYAAMDKAGWPMTPYVHSDGPPENGIQGFLDLPRYSTGYAALFQTLGCMPETHMLKPFQDRVRSTYHFLLATLESAYNHGEELTEARKQARVEARSTALWPIQWKLDTTRKETLLFGGYTAGYKPSEVTGLPRLYYNRHLPWKKQIPYYPRYATTLAIQRPTGWVVPQSWTAIIERLALNQVVMYRINSDTLIQTNVQYIESEKTFTSAYEGHYPHDQVEIREEVEQILVRAGDVWIPSDQEVIAYLMATMDPRAPDSWFAWNFMDGILGQKEYFSAYVFEDLAADILAKNPKMKAELELELNTHSEMRKDGEAILDWVYRKSDYYEPTHRRYPILAIGNDVDWSLRPFNGIHP